MRVAFGVNTIITDHFKMFVGDMNNQFFNKVGSGNGLNNQGIILMAVVMEGNGMAIIVINTGRGNDRSAQISANILNHIFGISKSRFSIDIETVGTMLIDKSLGFFKGTTDMSFKKIKKSRSEGISEEGIIKMFDRPPNGGIAGGTFRKQDMNMRVPLQASAEGV